MAGSERFAARRQTLPSLPVLRWFQRFRYHHISVRTLLPLANHVRAVLASRDAEREGDDSPIGQVRRQRTTRSGVVQGEMPCLWSQLPLETRRQLAQHVGQLLQRLRPPAYRSEEGHFLLSTASLADERITTAHRAKLSYVYVRQSSPGQVRHHQESTELQYRLVERAVLLGWPRERVHVIDDDLGKSGATSRDRYGFQTLIADVGLGKAGLVMSLDASGSRATTGTGISSSSCARCSVC